MCDYASFIKTQSLHLKNILKNQWLDFMKSLLILISQIAFKKFKDCLN